jgi:hypothetical protein
MARHPKFDILAKAGANVRVDTFSSGSLINRGVLSLLRRKKSLGR